MGGLGGLAPKTLWEVKSTNKKSIKKEISTSINRMNTKEKIPYRFRNIFNTWEEYRDWCIEKSKEELLKAFPDDN